MSYSNFNMRLDDNLRNNAYPILEKYGLTPSQAVKMFFNQIAQTGKVPLSFDWADTQTLTEKVKIRLLKTQQEFENGEFETFDNLEELNQAMAESARG